MDGRGEQILKLRDYRWTSPGGSYCIFSCTVCTSVDMASPDPPQEFLYRRSSAWPPPGSELLKLSSIFSYFWEDNGTKTSEYNSLAAMAHVILIQARSWLQTPTRAREPEWVALVRSKKTQATLLFLLMSRANCWWQLGWLLVWTHLVRTHCLEHAERFDNGFGILTFWRQGVEGILVDSWLLLTGHQSCG